MKPLETILQEVIDMYSFMEETYENTPQEPKKLVSIMNLAIEKKCFALAQKIQTHINKLTYETPI